MLIRVYKLCKFAFWAGLFSVAMSGGAVAAAYYSTLDELPDVKELKHVSFETPMKIYTQDGKLIGEFGEHKRIPVSLDQIPLKMQQAFLAIEDSRFYEHSGVDPIGILRAVAVAVTSGGASQGASTITQQVARNFFLTRDRTIERKIKEMFIAWRMEQVLSKQEILELYLNKIALGHRSYGVVAAAQTYYGKSLDELTLAEIATIAGLPKAPSTLNPITNPQRAKERRHLVLQRMLTLGFITPEEFQEADAAPSKATFHSAPLEAYVRLCSTSMVKKPTLRALRSTPQLTLPTKNTLTTRSLSTSQPMTCDMVIAAHCLTSLIPLVVPKAAPSYQLRRMVLTLTPTMASL